MSDWLKTLLGVEDKEIPEGAITSFEFANLPRGSAALLLTLAAAALLFGVFWVYRREGSASTRAKMVLAALRALVFVAAGLLILEPVLAISQIEEIDKSTVVLLDESLSMSTKDRYVEQGATLERAGLEEVFGVDPATMTRAELVDLALERSGLLGALTLRNPVKVFTFSEDATPAASLERRKASEPFVGGFRLQVDAKGGGRGTNLAAAIRGAVEEVGSDRIAAILLVSDGRVNLGPPPEDVALFLKNKALTLHTVSVGDAEEPRNLRCIALAGPDRAFRNDPVVLDMRVSGRGYPGATVVFERRYADTEVWETLGSKPVAFPEAGQPVADKFTDKPPRTGTVEYRIRIAHEPDEVTHLDNEKTFVVRVVDEKAKVLFVAGGPAHDYHAIKNTLLRDATVQVSCFLQSADPKFPQDGNGKPLTSLPATEEQLFEFDVIMLHDADGTKLPPGWGQMLKKFVKEHSGGLGIVAGNKHTLELMRGPAGKNDFADLLPVVLDYETADMPGTGIGYGRHFRRPWRMAPEPAALTHPATRFHSDPKRAKELVWERLPSFYWFFPVLKEKPGAVVLTRHEDPTETVEPYGRRPILAVHRYGGGRVLFLAADETFRWRSVAETVFDRFWVQSVRFLMEGRLAGAKRRFRVFVDREVVDRGDAVRITAQVFDENFDPYTGKEAMRVVVKHRSGTEDEVALLPLQNKEGYFQGSYAADELGDYSIEAAEDEWRPKDGGTTLAEFMVVPPDREMGDVRVDRGLMALLAARTRGISPPLHEISRLSDPKLIPPASERVVIQGKPIPLWDTWTTIIVILVLLSAEWILRKRFRMV